jgi:hypothetical protein
VRHFRPDRPTELIQSSPLAVERSVRAAIGGAYPSQRITTLELRYDPMKRNRGGEATSTTSSWPRSAVSTAPASGTRMGITTGRTQECQE